MTDRDRIKALIYVQPFINTRELMDITELTRLQVYNHCSHMRALGMIESHVVSRNLPTQWVPSKANQIAQAQDQFLYRKRAA